MFAKFFRIALIVLVLVSLLIGLTACGGGGGDNTCTDGNASDCDPVVEKNPTTELTCALSPNSPGCK